MKNIINERHEETYALGTIEVLRQHVFGFFRPPTTHLRQHKYYCKSAKMAIFWPHPPKHLFADVILELSLIVYCSVGMYAKKKVLLFKKL